jgi:hypothetical protein
MVAVMALLTSACSTLSNHTAQAPPSTLAPGSPWLGIFTDVALPVPVNSVTAVACATASSCWAVGSTVGDDGAPNGAAIIATTDGGAHWVNQAAPGTVSYLSGISCSDRHHCTAVGQTASGLAAIVTTADPRRRHRVLPAEWPVRRRRVLGRRADRAGVGIPTRRMDRRGSAPRHHLQRHRCVVHRHRRLLGSRLRIHRR